MALVHELSVHKGHIDTLGNKSFGYCDAYLLFDDNSTSSLKDHTGQLTTAGRFSDRGYKVDDNTHKQRYYNVIPEYVYPHK